jgi:hypothetical protein
VTKPTALPAWPKVPADEYGQMTCPLPACGEPLHLHREHMIALVAEQNTDHDAADAISDYWEVKCIADHVIYTSVDHAKAIDEDTTCETAVEYNHMAVHQLVHTLRGDRP